MDTIKKIDWWIAGSLILLMIGLGVGVFLVSQPKVFRSKAAETDQILQSLEYQDLNGEWKRCDGSTNPPTCNTSNPDFIIRYRP